MMEFLRNWIINIVTIAVFIVILEIMIPAGKVRKVINLISGFVLIIAIMNPVFSLFNSDLNLEEIQISQSNFLDKREIEVNSKLLKEGQVKQLTELYRKKVIGQIEKSILEFSEVAQVKADVIINEDYESTNFGEVKRVYIDLFLKNEESERGNAVRVEKINKVDISLNNETSQESIKQTSELEKKIQKKINEMFNIQKENVVINCSEA